MNSQKNDVKKDNLIEEGKKIVFNEDIKHNEFLNNSFKPYKTKSYCVNCKDYEKNINPRVSNTSNVIIKMCNMWQ